MVCSSDAVKFVQNSQLQREGANEGGSWEFAVHPELAQWNNPDAVGPSGKRGDPNKGVELPGKGERGYLAHSQATVGPWGGDSHGLD